MKSRLNLGTLDFFQVPEREKGEVLAAFAAHKGEVTEGYL
jgi:hemoglobin